MVHDKVHEVVAGIRFEEDDKTIEAPNPEAARPRQLTIGL
jgi:hypothetical protein